MSEYHYEMDADGIATVTFDAPGASANTMTESWVAAMYELLERLSGEAGLSGVVLASAKKTFFAGGNLKAILEGYGSPEAGFAEVERAKAPYRMLEKLPVPVVAAINGAALGGGYEMCLACNHRIALASPKAVLGLPEVTLGLLPGAGGIVRMVAMLGLEAALPLLLEGKQLKPEAALKAGLVDEIVAAPEDLIPAAKAWIKANPDAHTQAWDKKGFAYPGGGAEAPNVRMAAAMAPTMLFTRTRGLMPAPEKILDLAVNSMRMGFDSALRAESRGFAALAETAEAKAAIHTFFFGMQAIKGGKMRPEGAPWQASRGAILGAGMMGAGIAWAQAARGLPSLLKDVSLEAAEKGKAYSEGLAEKRVKRGRMDAAGKEALLGLITPTDQDADLEGADLIIEAVFEDIALKEKVIAETFPRLAPGGIYASNTSTLPISILAEACPEPERFIGLHFFSPVDKMRIVEIIMGDKTSEETLRKAYDYVLQLGYTPIVVNDKRGFFTSRVFGTYLDEGLALLRDGMDPVAIERAGWKAGMPVGPLAVHDEVSLVLTQKIRKTHEMLDARLGIEGGFPADDSANAAVAGPMVEAGRGGRHYGGGFYDYAEGGSKSLWDGLAQFKARDLEIPIQDAVDRLLFRQAIETLRCFEEGVLRSAIEGDIGSIFAIGFPAHTGGALRFIKGMGADFAPRAAALEAAYGPRFAVTEAMLAKLEEAP